MDDFGLRPPVKPEEIPSSIKANVEGHKAAEELLAFAKEEYGGKVNNRFWEVLRDRAMVEAGPPLNPRLFIPKMSKTEAKKFSRMKMPRGQYAESSVQFVLDRDRGHLVHFCTNPDFFQKKMQSFLLWEECERIEKNGKVKP